jgi:hypothetical protein
MTFMLTFLGTTLGRWAIIGGGVLAFVTAYTWQQRSIGAHKARVEIVTKSNEVARERSQKVRKIRNSIKPSDAAKRLLSEYGHPATSSN